MVRTRDKKPRGDDAFEKRTQKVGRRKLAPATATRAEVHARTLRLSTASAVARAVVPTVSKGAGGTLAHPHDGKRRRKELEEERKSASTLSAHSFSELLTATHHYKSANRASALSTMAKALALQQQFEVRESQQANPFAGYLSLARPSPPPASAASTSGAASTGASSSVVTPLEKLKAYAAALEAITDTDDDVRRAAMSCLSIIIRRQWISSASPSAAAPAAAAAPTAPPRGRGAAGAEPSIFRPASMEELVSGLVGELGAAHGHGANGSVFGLAMHSTELPSAASTPFAPSSSTAGAWQQPDVAEMDRLRAALQAVHIAVTHAVKSVRLAGVQLLELLLTHARPGHVLAASREVYRQQQSYLPEGLNASALHPGIVAAGHGADSISWKEEEWLVALVKRISQLVLRTKDIRVLPMLLAALVAPQENADGLHFPVPRQVSAQSGRGEATGPRAEERPDRWQNPELMARLLDDLLSPWANAWKELMELQLGLFRQDEKLSMAVALGQAFATVLHYLKHAQLQGGRGVRQQLLSREKQQLMKDLFIHRVPVSMEEILGAGRRAGRSDSAHSPAASPRRVELALVLAQVCTPLASTDEGWGVLRRFFKAVFAARRDGGEVEASVLAPPALAPQALLHAVHVYLAVLKLFPQCIDEEWLPSPLRSSAEASRNGSSSAEGGLWATAAAAEHGKASAVSDSVAERALLFGPAALQAITRAFTEYARGRQQQQQQQRRASSTGEEQEAAVLAQLLLCASAMVHQFALYPSPYVHDNSSNSNNNSNTTRALHDVFAGVPRLLFALRPQPAAAPPAPAAASSSSSPSPPLPSLSAAISPAPLRKRSRSPDARDTESDGTEEEESSVEEPNRANGAGPQVPVPATLLIHHPLVVDVIVQRFLRVLWFLASSGHPLLRGPTQTLRQQLRVGLQPLFGSTLPSSGEPTVVEGVLARCSTATVRLGQEVLVYLGVRDNAKLVVRRSQQSQDCSATDAPMTLLDVLQVLPSVQAAA